MFATPVRRRPAVLSATRRSSGRLPAGPVAHRRLRLEALEDRRLLAINPLTSLPALHSNPGAPVSVYLDFNGDYEPTGGGGYGETWTPVYDCDGDATTYSDLELANIRTVWAMVGEDFAPFNVDVTTVEPAVLADNVPRGDANGVALRVAIGGKSSDWYSAGYGGLSYNGSFTNSVTNIAYVFPGSLPNVIADTVSHEAGHAFGLREQSLYDDNGVQIYKYNPGDYYSWVPLMGQTYYSTPASTWYNGLNVSGVAQDDMAIIGGTTNGFGYRSDDHGNTIGTATPLTPVGNTWTKAGVIETNTDVDDFSFTVTTEDCYRVAASVPAVGPNLDAVVELYKDGQLIASASPHDTQYAQIVQSLAPGNYAVCVKSTGVYGWVGSYTLNIDSPPAGIIITPASPLTTTGEEASQLSFAMVLQRPPLADVTINLSSSDTSEGTVSPASVTFTPDNWSVPQNVTATGVDDALIDGDKPYTIFTAPATSADPSYNNLDAVDLSLINTDNDRNVSVNTSLPLVTTEAGATTTFTVALRLKPTADVTIPLSSGDTTEGTVSPSSVTFTPENWSTPQTVTMTGADDAEVDGDVPYTVVTAPAISADPRFNNVDALDVTLTNNDNELPRISIRCVSTSRTTETGAAATLKVVLDTAPTSDVTFGLSSSDTTEGTLSVTRVTFTPGNWSTPQTVTVNGVDDPVDDGNVPYTILTTPAVSADPNYNNLDPADVVLTNSDNDGPGVMFTPVSGRLTTEAGGTATFTVVLNSQPTANVTIGLSSGDTTEGIVSPAGMTFTPANWNTPQTITVTGVGDSVLDGNVVYPVITAPAISEDPSYQGLNPADISIVNLDNRIETTTKFYVVNDASQDKTYEYSPGGSLVESYRLGSGNSAPRGAATTSVGDKVWVVDANRKVYVYTPSGGLLGSWSAGTIPTKAAVEGIATNGTDVWIVDAQGDKVYCYSGAATRLSGTQNATSTFSLNSGNTSPKDITTDGVYLWVVNDSTTDKVFKYALSGTLVGSWTIDPLNSKPTGLTVDPANVSNIWIVDSGTKKVYQYNAAASRTSGSQAAAATFVLAAGNTNPQGIADPPSPDRQTVLGMEEASARPRPEWIAAVDLLMSDSDTTTGRKRWTRNR